MHHLSNNLEKKSNFINSNIFLWLVFIVSSFIILLFTEANLSPLYDNAGTDSIIFRVIGKGWTEGRIPYKDLFDHKGPFIFLVNAIGSLVGDGRIGIFLLSVIFFSVSLFFAHKISFLFLKNNKSYIVDLFFILFFIYNSENGNYTEEWNLPFILMSIYFALKFLFSNKNVEEHPFHYSFIYGIGIGILGMTRLNNAIPICGIILCFIILLIKRNQWGKLFLNACFVLLGIVSAVLPFCVYFYTQDAFSDFIYSTFTFNFIYAKNANTDKNVSDLVKLFLVNSLYFFIELIFCFILIKNKKIESKISVFILCVSIPTILGVLMGGSYRHYWLIDSASYIFTFCLLFIFFKNSCLASQKYKRNILIFISGIILSSCMQFLGSLPIIAHSILVPIEKIFNIDIKKDGIKKISGDVEIPTSKEIINIIPEDDRDKVFVYNAHFFYSTDVINIMPYEGCRYFCLQPWHSFFNNDIGNEIISMMNNNPPKYVVTNYDKAAIDEDLVLDSKFNSIIDNKYMLVYKNKDYKLFKMK